MRVWSIVLLASAILLAVAPPVALAARPGKPGWVLHRTYPQRVQRAWRQRVTEPLRRARVQRKAKAVFRKVVVDDRTAAIYRARRGDTQLDPFGSFFAGASFLAAIYMGYETVRDWGYSGPYLLVPSVAAAFTFGLLSLATGEKFAEEIRPARLATLAEAQALGHPLLDPQTAEGRENLEALKEAGWTEGDAPPN